MYVILLILALIAAYFIIAYNSLVALRQKTNEAWSDIDTQLKRRYDLIPNLVETVKGYTTHETQTLEKIVEARTASMNAQSVDEKGKAENMLSGALKSLFAVAEAYPDLKANENFMQLQNTLKEVEEHIQLSRRYYNATVRDLNTKIEVFPNNLFAKQMGFTQREFFQAEEGEKENVQVNFNNPPTTPPVPPAPVPPSEPMPPTPPMTPPETPPQEEEKPQ